MTDDRRPWPPALRATLGWHALIAAAAAAAPAKWPLWLAAIAANHALLTAAGMMPRSVLLGPNLTRLPPARCNAGRIALTFDDGPDPEVTPRVLDLLRDAGQRASFFCIGERVAAYPALAQRIVDDGHQIENHTQRHRHHFALLGPSGLRRELLQAQQTIARVAGTAPRFFRAPAGLRSPLLQPVLAALGLRLAAWTRRGLDTVDADARRVHARLTRALAERDIVLLHDGNAARGAGNAPVVLQVLPGLLQSMQAAGLASVPLREAVFPTGCADEA
ncbi:MAG TPA: polysaccharide deacetylase family protein [Burkholderiaceae bacterium]|nr:polysaccharide deacetylase family protein [Burkholderiaceae bacterium]